mgnify:CR=1 FL=1
MRLQIVDTGKFNSRCYNGKIMSVLKDNIGRMEDIELTDLNPDIIHLFGNWDVNTLSMVKSLHRRHIPMVLTSVNGLQSLVSLTPLQVSLMKQITGNVVVTHVCGKYEELLLSNKIKGIRTHIIHNAVISNIITVDEMISKMARLYEDMIKSYDKQICDKIRKKVDDVSHADESISNICRQILYIKYLHNRGSIPQIKINELSQTMIDSRYDEDKMGGFLKSLGIYEYTSSLLSVLNQKSSLTEGFMPIAETDDKTAEGIINCITNYK